MDVMLILGSKWVEGQRCFIKVFFFSFLIHFTLFAILVFHNFCTFWGINFYS